MGDLAVTIFRVLGVLAVALLAISAALKSRPLMILGGSMAASLALTWILGLFGLPIGIFFGFLSFGGLFSGTRGNKPRDSDH